MRYVIVMSPQFERSLRKLKRKDKNLFMQVQKKLIEIAESPERFKPLRNVLSGFRRVHFRSFVLIFKVHHDEVLLITLDHHDRAY